MLSLGWFFRQRIVGLMLAAMIGSIALAQEPAPESAAAQAPGVYAGPLLSRSMGSGGNWAQGFYGDYVLTNKHLRATISNIAQDNNIFPSGGFLLDLCKDSLPLDYFSYFNTLVMAPTQRRIVYTKTDFVETGYANAAKAVVVSGHVERNEKLTAKTEYILEPEARFIRVITTVKNDTGQAIEQFNIFDEVNWGALGVFMPGYGYVSTVKDAQVDWIGGFLDDLSIVIGSPMPNAPLKITFNHTVSQVYYHAAAVTLGAGQERRLERIIFVGDADSIEVSAALYQMKNVPMGIITGTMLEEKTNNPIPDTEIRIVQNKDAAGEHVPNRPFSKAQTDARGRFTLRLPAGSYFVHPDPFGRTRENLTFSVDVVPNRTIALELKASPPIYLNYTVVDADTQKPLPCKLSFVNISPTRYPNFGPPYKADGARHTVYSHTGQGQVQIEPGYYGVFVSHGLEYNISKNEIEVKATGDNQLKVELKREMPLNGYVGVDFGVRTSNSWDTPVTPRDRVISAAAEGVDIIVTGDANIATDLTPVINELNLQNQLRAITGMRVEYDRKDVPGNFLLFPVPGDATAKAPEFLKATSADQLFKSVAQAFPRVGEAPQTAIAVMRPLMPVEGYFHNLGWDVDTGRLERADAASYAFDFLDVWEGKRQGVLEMNNHLNIWLNYNGRFPGLIGGTNSHFLFGEETGYPRVYVPVSSDNPANVNVSELLANIKAGKVIITNGPFIDFKVNGKGLGEVVSDTDGDSIIDCELIVRAPSWIQTDFIDIMGDGMFRKRIIRRSYNTTYHHPPAGKPEEAKFRMRLHRDMILQVKVVGERSLEPVVTKYGAGEEDYVRPYAITGPIYLDLDGDGLCKPGTDYTKRAE